MAHDIRIRFAALSHHAMARGNRREDIFHDDDDRRFFLHTLAQGCEMTGWRVHSQGTHRTASRAAVRKTGA